MTHIRIHTVLKPTRPAYKDIKPDKYTPMKHEIMLVIRISNFDRFPKKLQHYYMLRGYMVLI